MRGRGCVDGDVGKEVCIVQAGRDPKHSPTLARPAAKEKRVAGVEHEHTRYSKIGMIAILSLIVELTSDAFHRALGTSAGLVHERARYSFLPYSIIRRIAMLVYDSKVFSTVELALDAFHSAKSDCARFASGLPAESVPSPSAASSRRVLSVSREASTS